MPLAGKATRHRHPAQGGLRVLAGYLERFKDFLYSIVSEAASACQDELHKLPHAWQDHLHVTSMSLCHLTCQDHPHVTSCHHLSAARSAYLAVTVPLSFTCPLSLTHRLSFTCLLRCISLSPVLSTTFLPPIGLPPSSDGCVGWMRRMAEILRVERRSCNAGRLVRLGCCAACMLRCLYLLRSLYLAPFVSRSSRARGLSCAVAPLLLVHLLVCFYRDASI